MTARREKVQESEFMLWLGYGQVLVSQWVWTEKREKCIIFVMCFLEKFSSRT